MIATKYFRLFYVLGMIFLTLSCSNNAEIENLEKLNGYWEIDKVLLANGTERDFTINTTIDFIEVKGDSGVRKKVKPMLDGSFITSKAIESFFINVEGDSIHLQYSTPYNKWTETLLTIKDSSMSLLNQGGNIYYYKRFEKFSFNK